MSAAYLLGLGRDAEAEGDGDSAGTSAGVSSSDGRSILLFARGLGAQPADLVRLYERRDHFVAVDRDASTIAHSYFRSSAALKSWSLDEVPHPYLTINKKMCREVIRSCLLRQRLRLEVYVLDGNKWVLGRRGSPGNIGAFEDECLVNGELPPDASTVIAAVRLGRTGGSKGYSGNARLVGVSFVDVGARAIYTSEFEDDENLCTLESLLCQQGTREVLLHAEMDKADRKALEQMLDICEVATTEAPKGAFTSKHAEQDLKRLLGVDDDPASRVHARCFESQQQLPVGCFAALFRYLDLAGASETHGQWSLDWVEPREFVRLDASALRALTVEPQASEPDKNASLLGIFSVCKTAGGARLLRTWLKQPLLSAFEINQRLDLVQTFVSGFALRATLRDSCLPPMAADLDRLQRRLFSGKATLQDVVLLYSLLNGLPRLLAALGGDGYAEGEAGDEGRALVAYVFTEPLRQVESNFERFSALVSAAVDLDALARHEYLIRPHFDPGLAELGQQRDKVVEKMDSAHEALCDTLGLDDGRLKLENAAPHGYHFRVSRKEEKEIRGADVTILATKKDGVCFRDKSLEKLAAKYKELSARYSSEQSALVSKVVDTAATFCPVVSELSALLSKLDALLAFAAVSASAPEPFTRPILLGPDAPRTLILEGARHPCVERMESAGGGTGSFIKNDIRLQAQPASASRNNPAEAGNSAAGNSAAGNSAAGPSDASLDTSSGDASLAAAAAGAPALVLVTGPNCGGKSTYIRSVGTCVLLAQVGCFVPCDRAVLSPVDAILARVGAGDMQSRGVSTFMAEMLESSTILRVATQSSLVIIDELGRGTSTYDGYGIATAICSELLHRGCLTLFATHFHELTALAEKHQGVGNKHVAAHVHGNDLTMLFKVEDGPSDQSYGIAVAAACGFPPSVLDHAKRKLAQLEGDSSRAGPGTGGGGADSGGGKRARVRAVGAAARGEGLAELKQAVAAFASADLDKMPEGEQVAAVKLLAASLAQSKNEYIAALVEAASDGL